ncbi:carboxymuconolactone decarboxylase family protein [Amycolatopsis lurida]
MMVGYAPTLTGPLLDLVTALLTSLELTPRHREMLILLVSRETECEYEWVQHVPQAHLHGVRAAELSWIENPGLLSRDPADNLLLRCGRKYLHDHKLGPEDVDDLEKHFTARQIAEILLMLGSYRMFTLFINALEVDLDPAGEELAARFAAPATASAR